MEDQPMPKLIVNAFLTLDGVMQAPGGPDEDRSSGFEHGGWSFPYFDEVAGKGMDEQPAPADLLLGRKTFDIFASYWPEHGDVWPGVNEATKYVVSRTATSSEWSNSVFLNGDAA